MARTTKKATKNVLTMPIPAVATQQTPIPNSIDIAKRAFELYCERGRQDGYDLQDWLQAERELLTISSSAA